MSRRLRSAHERERRDGPGVIAFGCLFGVIAWGLIFLGLAIYGVVASPETDEAQAQFGWGGMEIEVVDVDLGWGVAAQTTPDYPNRCLIEIDRDAATPRTMLHEVGHCVGHFDLVGGGDHSRDAASVMSDFYAPGQSITPADWLALHRTRTRHLELHFRITAPMVGR